MPFDYDPNLDPENQQTSGTQTGVQGNTQLAGGGGITGGASATVGGGGGAAAPSGSQNAPGSPAPTSPGNYQNLNSYLDANSGNGFGQQFLGDVNKDVNAAGSAQAQGAQLFKGASDAGTVQQNPDVVNQALSDPYGFSQDPNNVQAFQSQTNATYKGPQTYQDDQAAYQQAAGATQKAENTAQAAQSEGGRFALLNNYFSTPNYNQGQQSLDNLLIQADPTTSQGINQARQNADQSQIDFQNQAAPLQQYAAQNNATTQATAQAAQTAGNNAIKGLNTDYANALTNAQAAQTNNWNSLQNQLAQGPSSYQAALGQYGIGGGPTDPYTNPANFKTGPGPQIMPGGVGSLPGSGAGAQSPNYWGVDASKFVNQGVTPDASNVLNLQQQQKLDALQSLMGGAVTPFNSAEAGQFDPTKTVSFDQTGFGQAMNTAENNYVQAQGGIQNQIQQILGTPQVGSLTGNNVQNQGVLSSLQAQYDQLNQIRAGYGLSPVANPYQVLQPSGQATRGSF